MLCLQICYWTSLNGSAVPALLFTSTGCKFTLKITKTQLGLQLHQSMYWTSINWWTDKSHKTIIKWAILHWEITNKLTFPDQLYALNEICFVAGKITAKWISCIITNTSRLGEISLVSNKSFWINVVFYFWLKAFVQTRFPYIYINESGPTFALF